MRSHRSQIILACCVSSVCALVAVSAPALAQNQPPDIQCKATETQAECHARLKCKPNEELEGCQKRLLKCKANEKLEDCKKRSAAGAAKEPANEGNAGQRDDADQKGGERNANETGREPEREKEGAERRDRDNADRERDERGNRDEDARPRRQRGDRQGDDDRRGARGRQKGFQASKTFGLGLELGEPTGLNGKLFLSKAGALDFGVGWIYRHYYYGDGLHLYADYLWHPTSLVSAPAFELPLYIGVGLRYWDFQYCVAGLCNYGGSAIGIRIPVGISFDFNKVPLDLFIQLVPVIDFIRGDYYDRFRDRAHFGIDLSVGIRYWFK